MAKRERCSVRQVNMTISLAFLAPAFVQAAIEGRLPRGIGVTRLRDAPVEWSRQQDQFNLGGEPGGNRAGFKRWSIWMRLPPDPDPQ